MCPIRSFCEITTLGKLAARVGGKVHGPEDEIVSGISIPSESGKDVICVIWSQKELGKVADESLIVAPEGFFSPSRKGIEIKDPRAALAELLSMVIHSPVSAFGIHPSAVVSESAKVDPSVLIGPNCIVAENAVIASGAVLEGNVYIGRDVHVGADSFIEPGAVIYHETFIGKKAVIHANSVIGVDGFGFIPSSDGAEPIKIPQVGRVIIGDNVEIGACCTVDRGTLGDTVIRDGVKTDDHVHIGHNTDIGRGCLLVAQTGIAGSSVLEDSVIMAARSGTADHVRVGKGAQVAAMGGAIKDVPPGAVVSGFPARDHRKNYRTLAMIQKLPELFQKVKTLEKILSSLDKGDK